MQRGPLVTLAESLAILATEAPRGPKGPRCTVCLILEQLTPEERAALQSCFENPKVSAMAISRALSGFGHPVAGPVVARHRRLECQAAAR